MTPTKTANPAADAERLAAAAAEAAAKADEARARAEEAAKRAEERRQADLTAMRRERLAAYDHDALVAEVREGERRFRLAIEEGKPGLHEFVAWQEVVSRHYLLATEARTIQTTLDPDASPMPVPGVAGMTYADAVQRVLAALIANRTADFEDARQAELDAAGR